MTDDKPSKAVWIGVAVSLVMAGTALVTLILACDRHAMDRDEHRLEMQQLHLENQQLRGGGN